MKVSIVIPVYNVETYLEQCIDSVIQQSYKDLEIILVNDGSTDNSGKICDEYVSKDSRVKVIHKPNGGLMSAWKAGFLSSIGKYVGFVDSDDWIENNMYEQLVKSAISHDADIAVCQLIKEFNELSNIKLKEKLRLEPGVYNSEKIKNEIIPGIINDGSYLGRRLSPNRVTKLFKRELIENNLQFCDDRISLGEDLITCFSCVCDAKTIVILPDYHPYHYRINNQSITGKYDYKRIEKVNQLNIKLSEIAKCKDVNIVEQIANDYISLALLCIECEILFSDLPKDITLNRIKDIYKSNLFTESLRNGNIEGFSIKHKVYLFLLKYNKIKILYILREMMSSIKSIIKNKEFI
ncbi:glycosyltransferase family 2 protein [Neobacillus bataviensis]|uniref:glycosyltransferase family 2 protein n=1 Tax=Neobacillus bataviensis TaxID=220685 RepID=UPI001CBD3FFF|nr:glycosyltransferase [Neobacillus bataviensis]